MHVKKVILFKNKLIIIQLKIYYIKMRYKIAFFLMFFLKNKLLKSNKEKDPIYNKE